jgi:hypothetical protein
MPWLRALVLFKCNNLPVIYEGRKTALSAILEGPVAYTASNEMQKLAPNIYAFYHLLRKH